MKPVLNILNLMIVARILELKLFVLCCVATNVEKWPCEGPRWFQLKRDVKMSKRCQNVKKMSKCQKDVKMSNVKKSNTQTMEEVHKKINSHNEVHTY